MRKKSIRLPLAGLAAMLALVAETGVAAAIAGPVSTEQPRAPGKRFRRGRHRVPGDSGDTVLALLANHCRRSGLSMPGVGLT